jgi:hypothetical protein
MSTINHTDLLTPADRLKVPKSWVYEKTAPSARARRNLRRRDSKRSERFLRAERPRPPGRRMGTDAKVVKKGAALSVHAPACW